MGLMAVVPGGFHQDAPGLLVAGLGETALAAGVATGVFGRHQPQVRHQGCGLREAGQMG